MNSLHKDISIRKHFEALRERLTIGHISLVVPPQQACRKVTSGMSRAASALTTRGGDLRDHRESGSPGGPRVSCCSRHQAPYENCAGSKLRCSIQNPKILASRT